MAVRIRPETSGSFIDHVNGRARAMATAVTAGVAGGTKGLQTEMRQQLERAGVDRKVGNMIGMQVYPRGGVSLGAAGSIYGRGAKAQELLDSFSRAEVIRARGGRYLAIPTGFNRAGGRKGGAVRITTREMAQMKGWTYVLPIRGGISQYAGGRLWFLRVTRAEEKGGRRSRTGVTPRAYAGGILQVGGGRRRRVDGILEAGGVPMFLLLPVVQRGQKFDPVSLAEKWAGEIPDLIARATPED